MNHARPMAARLINKQRVKHEPRSAHHAAQKENKRKKGRKKEKRKLKKQRKEDPDPDPSPSLRFTDTPLNLPLRASVFPVVQPLKFA